ncbi:fluoride efflux transporter FluC [Wenzhouxiangella sediminis]|jgi:CrcB protein|uniref:Fluoride-specific ion channel FluC n=1 Tax=Wenzhouxiangella sediminis TaxID=1792836 RepID=A0A3E1KBV3_9GAMM|nr:CrcB family protein [Wenzhouxiangella sediminis]RFF31979.1 CrcB family protein [Wenzhouxiangella sediminis]
MVELAWVGLGSALGAVARFGLGEWLLRSGFTYPLATTLAVNLSGCLAAGALAGSLETSGTLVSGFLLGGFLGSYTTVSTFSMETVGLWQSRRRVAAAGYVLVSIAGGLLFALAGRMVAAGIGS